VAKSPFEARQQALKAKGDKPTVSVDEALAVLRKAASSPQAQAALKTLEGQLQGGPENKGTPPENRGGFPSSNDVRSKMGGSDSGSGNSAPFEKRAKRAKAQAAGAS
jgi:hypothetical protein